MNDVSWSCLIAGALCLAASPGGSAAPSPTPPDLTAWSVVSAPAEGPPEAIGGYAAGCLRGARALAPVGPGYRVVRLRRRRFFGHPSLLSYVRTLGAQVKKAGLGRLAIGDLSQARGGPTPTGHRSHQTGLDVDIAYVAIARSAPTEIYTAPSVVDLARGQLNQAWSPGMARLLALAAQAPGVDRIFVHPAVKQALCTSAKGQPWLHRVRPWWGHHDHFHVRLTCPADSAGCLGHEPLPTDDGCGQDLAWWSSEDARKTREQRAQAATPPALPAACADLLPR